MGQGGNGASSYYHRQPPDPKVGLENQSNKEASRTQPHEQDMEFGFKDSTLPMSFESLERKFSDEVMKLAKEQSDSEDAENARHREEELSALLQQANKREEFLRKESQARLSQYQQASMSHYPSSGFGFGSSPTGNDDQMTTSNAVTSSSSSPTGNNDQMSMKDRTAEHTVQATTPSDPVFTQQPANLALFLFFQIHRKGINLLLRVHQVQIPFNLEANQIWLHHRSQLFRLLVVWSSMLEEAFHWMQVVVTSLAEKLSESKNHHGASGEGTTGLKIGFVVRVPGYLWGTVHDLRFPRSPTDCSVIRR
ncbi:unnamed protein product [Dovyalis caffra]|uniref:Uncharacterized protein n=1 Tax=Dovyalis caffra TaxID=77055 RepID=A0AAV1QXX6_9ROSI|nr:unnamed protein product [Dovyalis caffra]